MANGTGREARNRALVEIACFALLKLLLQTLVNRQYGFHRDELATLDDARHLAWGFVAYPPLTPFVGRVALTLFGDSLAGFRFFAALAQSAAIVMTADMARRMGGGRAAQWLAAIAVAVAPVSLAAGSLFQYVSFDYLWWVAAAWSLVALIESGDGRWWLATGAAIGLGVLTKYSMAFCVAGIVAAVLLTMRAQLRSKWLWCGVALSIAIAAPNLLWQLHHDFITLAFLKSIHARDIAIGRTDGFLLNQLYVPAHPFTIPVWIAGAIAPFVVPSMRRFRVLPIIALVAFAIFVVAHGRDYYTAPMYPMLLAAGSVWLVQRFEARPRALRAFMTAAVVLLAVGGGAVAASILPVAPVGSRWWRFELGQNGDLREEIGWPGLVEEIARVWRTIPQQERAHAAIFCANYGEAGAVGLYGPRLGLPPAISGVNSFWARGFGDSPPDVVVVVGGHRDRLEKRFAFVELAGRFPNPLHVGNEEEGHPDIFICRGPKTPWPVVWPQLRSFG